MARKLIFRLNVGLEDQAQYGIPNGQNSQSPPMEGDVMTIDDEKLANMLVNTLKLAEDYDAKAESERAEKIRKCDEAHRKLMGMEPPQVRQPKELENVNRD